jgi:hypothetical protein
MGELRLLQTDHRVRVGESKIEKEERGAEVGDRHEGRTEDAAKRREKTGETEKGEKRGTEISRPLGKTGNERGREGKISREIGEELAEKARKNHARFPERKLSRF